MTSPENTGRDPAGDSARAGGQDGTEEQPDQPGGGPAIEDSGEAREPLARYGDLVRKSDITGSTRLMDRRGNHHHPGGTDIHLPVSARGLGKQIAESTERLKAFRFSPICRVGHCARKWCRTFAVLCTQHRCSLVVSQTWRIAFQKPNAPSPIARLGSTSRPRALHVQQQLLPRLLALPVAVGDGDQLLLAVGGRPHQDQDALPAPLQADVEVDAVGPDVDVMLARQRPLAPGLDARPPRRP